MKSSPSRLVALAVALVAAVTLAAGCKTLQQSQVKEDSAAASAELKRAAVARVLTRVIDKLALAGGTKGFFFTRPPERVAGSRVLGARLSTIADDGAAPSLGTNAGPSRPRRRLELDFGPFADVLGAEDVQAMNQIMTFDLRGPPFALEAEDGEHAFDDEGTAVELMLALGFVTDDLSSILSSTASAYAMLSPRREKCRADPSSDQGLCGALVRQKDKGTALSLVEAMAINIYSGSRFTFINKLLRSRDFKDGRAAVAPGAESVIDRMDAFIILAMMSGINKLDPHTETVFRGVSGVFPSCEATPAAAPANPTPDTRAKIDGEVCAFYGAMTTYEECGFASSSVRDSVAISFLRGSSTTRIPVLFRIKPASGAQIRSLSIFVNEDEVLFKPFTRYKMVGQQLAFSKNSTLGNSLAELDLKPCQEPSAEDAARPHVTLIDLEEVSGP